jgi:hypothetical protein
VKNTMADLDANEVLANLVRVSIAGFANPENSGRRVSRPVRQQ